MDILTKSQSAEIRSSGTPQIVLKARNVVRRFGGVVALNQLNLDVVEGQILGLIGPNGSGKTTFFNVLTGIYAADEGSISFLDKEITNLPAPQVFRSGIARTFQRARVCLSLSVFDNIVLGDHPRLQQDLVFNLFRRSSFRREYEECVERVRELLEMFAPHLVAKMFEPVETFPMIDRRRIEVCRALFSSPQLLLLDEPSAGMTHEETRLLVDEIVALRAKRHKLSIIIVEHEMDLISRITDRCIVLNFGSKICEGTYDEIASDRNVQEAYLGVEA